MTLSLSTVHPPPCSVAGVYHRRSNHVRSQRAIQRMRYVAWRQSDSLRQCLQSATETTRRVRNESIGWHHQEVVPRNWKWYLNICINVLEFISREASYKNKSPRWLLDVTAERPNYWKVHMHVSWIFMEFLNFSKIWIIAKLMPTGNIRTLAYHAILRCQLPSSLSGYRCVFKQCFEQWQANWLGTNFVGLIEFQTNRTAYVHFHSTINNRIYWFT